MLTTDNKTKKQTFAKLRSDIKKKEALLRSICQQNLMPIKSAVLLKLALKYPKFKTVRLTNLETAICRAGTSHTERTLMEHYKKALENKINQIKKSVAPH